MVACVVDGSRSETAVSVRRATAPPPAPTTYSSEGLASANRMCVASAQVGVAITPLLGVTACAPLPSLFITYTACGLGDTTNASWDPSGENTGSVLAAERWFVRLRAGPTPASSIEK